MKKIKSVAKFSFVLLLVLLVPSFIYGNAISGSSSVKVNSSSQSSTNSQIWYVSASYTFKLDTNGTYQLTLAIYSKTNNCNGCYPSAVVGDIITYTTAPAYVTTTKTLTIDFSSRYVTISPTETLTLKGGIQDSSVGTIYTQSQVDFVLGASSSSSKSYSTYMYLALAAGIGILAIIVIAVFYAKYSNKY